MDSEGNSRKLFLNKHADDSVDVWDDDSQLIVELSGHRSGNSETEWAIEALPF